VKRDFLLMWLFIIGVSVHDGFLVLAHRSSIAEFELNPVGRWLLHSNGGDIWILLGAKTLGTLAASSILMWLYWLRPRLGWTVCAVICLLQLVLLIFLYLPGTLAPRPLVITDSRYLQSRSTREICHLDSLCRGPQGRLSSILRKNDAANSTAYAEQQVPTVFATAKRHFECFVSRFGPIDEWHVDIEFTPFAIKLDNLDYHLGFQVCPG